MLCCKFCTHTVAVRTELTWTPIRCTQSVRPSCALCRGRTHSWWWSYVPSRSPAVCTPQLRHLCPRILHTRSPTGLCRRIPLFQHIDCGLQPALHCLETTGVQRLDTHSPASRLKGMICKAASPGPELSYLNIQQRPLQHDHCCSWRILSASTGRESSPSRCNWPYSLSDSRLDRMIQWPSQDLHSSSLCTPPRLHSSPSWHYTPATRLYHGGTPPFLSTG